MEGRAQLDLDVEGRGFHIRSERWPDGVTVLPPAPEHPWWRTGEDERITFATVVAGQVAETAALLGNAHADSICRIARQATSARLGGDHARSRALAAAAGRLCGEISGLHAQDAWKPAR